MNIFRRNKPEPLSDPLMPVFLVAGLGNPGREYRENRHNVGFMVVDRLAADLKFTMSRVQNKAITAAGSFEDRKVILAKPQTYMNLSGEAVSGLMRFYKISTENMMVIYDDLDLPFGTLRIRPAGGSAGQKGVQSIIDRLGTQDFPRLRFGIGRPSGSKQGANYVLNNFNAQEHKELDWMLDRAAAAVKVFLVSGLSTAMNQFNGSSIEG